MIVKVADLSDVVRRARFRESAGTLNEILGRSAPGVDECFEEDLDVDAELYRSGSDVYLQGRVTGTVRCACRRCLDETHWPLEREFRFLLVKEGDEEGLEDDTGLDHYSGEEIDLGPLIREQALLALDESVLCSEDCKGLCAGCGANLNREPCTCRR